LIAFGWLLQALYYYTWNLFVVRLILRQTIDILSIYFCWVKIRI
jgi:hypothetical protein